MQISISTRHGDIKAEHRSYMERKLEKLLHYFERVTQIDAVVDMEVEHKLKVEIQVDAEHRHDFVCTNTGYELIPVFDVALHKMEQQIRRYKEKLVDHRGDPSSRDVVESEVQIEEES